MCGWPAGPGRSSFGLWPTDEREAAFQALERVGSRAELLDAFKGFIEELPVEDASVDWVISNCVINLSPNKPQVFSEIARVLKAGGRMRVADIVGEAHGRGSRPR